MSQRETAAVAGGQPARSERCLNILADLQCTYNDGRMRRKSRLTREEAPRFIIGVEQHRSEQGSGQTVVRLASNVATAATDAVAVACVRAMTFDDVFVCHQAEIFKYAMQLTRDRHDAEDLYQETLIKAYRAFHRLSGEANYRAWLYRIATNTFLSGRRKAGREEALDDTVAAEIPSTVVDEASRLDAKSLLSDVDRFITTLPDKQRAALVLRKYHEMEYADIAASLKCSEAAARASVHEALRKLKERFADRL